MNKTAIKERLLDIYNSLDDLTGMDLIPLEMEKDLQHVINQVCELIDGLD